MPLAGGETGLRPVSAVMSRPGSSDESGSPDCQYVSPEEFTSLSGLSIATVRRYLAKGKLPKVQPGGPGCRVMIPRDALEQIRQPSGIDAGETDADNHPSGAASSSAPLARPSRLNGPLPRWQKRS